MSLANAVCSPFLPNRQPTRTERAATPANARPIKASTARAYEKDVRQYREVFGGSIPCDQRMLKRYIASLRTRLSPTSIHRRVMALRYEHLRQGLPSPTDAPTLRHMLRQLQLGVVPDKSGAAPTLKKKEPRPARPMTRALLTKVMDAMGSKALDRRDRCLMLLGFATALSRSALTALDVSDVTFTNDVIVLRLRPDSVELESSAQTRAMRTITVPITNHELCAARATREMIQHAALDLEGGPLFRRFNRAGEPTSERLASAWVSVVVKKRLQVVGVDPAEFSALSLRRGRIAELARGTM